MLRSPYPTDLNDKEWTVIEPYVPPPKTGGRPAKQIDAKLSTASPMC
jgi:transposase